MYKTGMQTSTSEVLLIEDDLVFRKNLATRLRAGGITVFEAGNKDIAKKLLSERRFTFVIIDHELNGEKTGIQLCKQCLTRGIRDFAIVTGHDDDETAKEFFSLGINSFIPKTRFVGQIDTLICKIRSLAAATQLDDLFARHFETTYTHLKNEIRSVASSMTDKSIFITGETGVGKTSVATLIHALSGAPGNFVHLNCAQSASLIESELFGHEKGAFTGADTAKKGKMLLANNGTLFLDEIGSLSPRAQEKLLLAVEQRKFYPLGSNKEIQVNFRLISATKEDLLRLIKFNKFRDDLFYRIAGITLNIPPLRKRPDDIPQFIKRFLDHLPQKIILSDEARDILLKYSWPGNIRQLKQVIEAFELETCGYITPEMLSGPVKCGITSIEPQQVLSNEQYSLIQQIGLPRFVDMIEQESVRRSMDENNLKQIAASSDLKITKAIFYRIYGGMTNEPNPPRPGLRSANFAQDQWVDSGHKTRPAEP